MSKLNIKALNKIDPNYLFILIISSFVFLYFDPFRVFYWSADQDLLFIKYSLSLSEKKIDYDHTGIFAFIFYHIIFKLLFIFKIIRYDNLSSFVSNLNEIELDKAIFIIRIINNFVLVLILWILYKIFKILGLKKSTSFYLIILFSLSKPFLSYHFETRTDLFSVLLITVSVLLILKGGYLYLISFFLTLAYVNKVNFLPILFFFPILIFILKRDKLKKFDLEVEDNILLLIFFIIFFYFIFLFRFSLNGIFSFNTDLPISMFSTFYQLAFITYFYLLFFFFENKILPLDVLINIIFGCLLTIFFATFFIEKNIIIYLFNPYEHLLRYSSSEINKSNIVLNLFFNKNLDFYKSLIQDNFFILFFLFLYFFLKIKSKLNFFNKYDFLIIFSFFFLNFQLLRGHYVRYEVYPSIFLIIYLACVLKESLFKKKIINIILVLFIILITPFLYNIKNNNISYLPFISQTHAEICGMGKDWIKGDFGNYLLRYCN